MPEAAEVAVAAAQLAHVGVGRVLEALPVTHPRTVRHLAAGDDLAELVGGRIVAVERRGKWLLVRVAGRERALGIHLRMSGQLLAHVPDERHVDRHVHAELVLGRRREPGPAPDGAPAPPTGATGSTADPVSVWFRDPRTFGELRLLDPDAPPVGPDLLDPAVTAASLARHALRRRVGAKAVLLDQTGPVSGIGSYLADEALHAAGISPVRPASSLAPSAWGRVLDAARSLTVASTAAGGVTLPDEGWVDLWGRPGRFGSRLRVHGREACATCGTPVRRATVGGRSARWCPRCQHPRRSR